MSHFYGEVQGNRGWASRGGSSNSGIMGISGDGALVLK